MTIYDYHLTMKVGIAQLKARLSEYLRHVRQGESIVIMDRKTPVGSIVPYRGAMPLSLRAASGTKPCDIQLPPPPEIRTDVVELLLEDRASGR